MTRGGGGKNGENLLPDAVWPAAAKRAAQQRSKVKNLMTSYVNDPKPITSLPGSLTGSTPLVAARGAREGLWLEQERERPRQAQSAGPAEPSKTSISLYACKAQN